MWAKQGKARSLRAIWSEGRRREAAARCRNHGFTTRWWRLKAAGHDARPFNVFKNAGGKVVELGAYKCAQCKRFRNSVGTMVAQHCEAPLTIKDILGVKKAMAKYDHLLANKRALGLQGDIMKRIVQTRDIIGEGIELGELCDDREREQISVKRRRGGQAS